MLRRWARFVVFIATAATLWLLVGESSAMAAGPLCDDRGATWVAPSPTLIFAEQSLLAGDADDCATDAQQLALQRHRAPRERIVVSASDAALPTAPLHVFAPSGTAPSWFVTEDAPAAGIRTRVERPPRV